MLQFTYEFIDAIVDIYAELVSIALITEKEYGEMIDMLYGTENWF